MFHKKQFPHLLCIEPPKSVRSQVKSVCMKEVAAVNALKSTIRKFKILNIKLNEYIVFSMFSFFIV